MPILFSHKIVSLEGSGVLVYVTLKTSKGVKCYTIDGLHIKQYHMGLSVTLKASRDVLCLIGKPKGVLYIFFGIMENLKMVQMHQLEQRSMWRRVLWLSNFAICTIWKVCHVCVCVSLLLCLFCCCCSWLNCHICVPLEILNLCLYIYFKTSWFCDCFPHCAGCI